MLQKNDGGEWTRSLRSRQIALDRVTQASACEIDSFVRFGWRAAAQKRE